MTGTGPQDGPKWVDGYQILGVLGEGGMGTIYRAQQFEPVKREVALKILKLGMDTEQVVARFRAERQALAVMNHPSVAKVFDAGATEAGRPYFVMELVEGVPVDEFCDRERLDTRARARLFVRICRAVQHAHQKGVIHRDLKPSNILVTLADDEPLPTIIDFGIARAVHVEDDGTRLTRVDQSVGTPAYMAPEQIEGGVEDVDTRTDIYSLGVILYELLTGQRPFEPRGGGNWAVWAKALLEDAPRPSARVAELDSTQQTVERARSTDLVTLRRELRGDLDWITLKALEKDRDRRYETANGFAVDLERYLADEPVVARPPSTMYRTGKFIRRHTIGVAFSAMLVALLTGFGVLQTVQAERIRQARDLADARRSQAEGLIDYMLSDVRAKLEPLGQLDVLDDVGQQAMIYFAALPVDEFSDDELASRSQALYQIGQVRLEQGNLPSADTALQESLRLADALSARAPDDTGRLFGLSQAHFWVGELARRRGNLSEALTNFEVYRDISADLFARDSTNQSWRMEVGYSHTNVGAILRQRGDAEAAVREFKQALDIKQALVASDPTNRRFRFDESRSHNTLGIALMESGRLDEALAAFEADVALKEGLVSDAPENATYTNRLAASLGFLAQLLDVLDRVDEAKAIVDREIRIDSTLVARDPTNARWLRNLASARMVAGHLDHQLGNHGASELSLREAVSQFRSLLADTPDQPGWAADLADAYRRLAVLHVDLDEGVAARLAADSAVTITRPLASAMPDAVAIQRTFAESLIASGLVNSHAGLDGRARADWGAAVEAMHRVAPASSDWRILAPRARARLLLGDPEGARADLDALIGSGYVKSWLVEPG